MKDLKALLQNTFSGRYQFHRTVSFPLVTYEGVASFAPLSQTHIKYGEEGTYKRGDDLQEAYQEREFLLEENGFLLLKSDGSILHHFDDSLADTNAFPLHFSHTHVCKNDLYHCVFSIGSPNKFSTHYTIKGPLKDYEIKTVYSRALIN